MNEKAIIKRCQKGDKDAFEELIRMYYPYVSGFLLKTTRNETLTEDLTQDAFLKMIRSIDRYNLKGSAGFGTWIITIAKNCYIDYLRRNHICFEDIANLQLDSCSDILTEVIKKIQYEEVLETINTLPSEQRTAILMKYEEDMTLAQIAEQFNVPPKTIKSRIHEGTVKLRKLLNTQERKDVL